MTPKLMFKMLFLVVFLLSSGAAAAADLQVVRIPVESQRASERETVLLQALEQAMLRLTGTDGAVAQPVVDKLLATPNRFVQQYRYEHRGERLELAVTVDLRGLAQALAAEGVATWSPDRPPVLVWLALERGGQRLLVGADEADGVRNLLAGAAERRGVRVMLPLLDGEDRAKVSVADLWGGFAEPILAASERYGTQTVLIGRVHSEAGGRVARWDLFTRAGSEGWRSVAATDEDLLSQGARELAERLRPLHARLLREEGGESLRLQVAGVPDLAAYSRVERYLQGVNGVRSVQPLGLTDDNVVFQLMLNANPQRVLDGLARGSVLAEVEPPVAPAADAPRPALEHHYRLQVP